MTLHENMPAKSKPIGKRRALPNGLTEKQEAFAHCVANGMSYSTAYRLVYDCKPDAKTSAIYTASWEVANTDKVSKRIDELVNAPQRERERKPERLRQRALDGLILESSEAKSDAARVSALIALGKAGGLFAERHEVTISDQATIEQVKKDLARKLRALLMPVIEQRPITEVMPEESQQDLSKPNQD
jgi:hypothetical protein